MHDLFLHAVHQHVIRQYVFVLIDDMHCKECRDSLYQILLCNLSPISTMWKTFNATMQKIILFTETVWKLYFSNCEKQYFNMKTECDLIVQRAQLNTREEFLAWKQRCDNFIESLEKQMLNDYRLMLNNRWSLVSRDSKIWKILCANVLCKWMPDIMQDFDGMSIRKSYIDAVIKSGNIEPHQFLEDARECCKLAECMQSIVIFRNMIILR